MHSGSPFRQHTHHFLLVFGGMHDYGFIVCFGPGQVQLISRFDVSDFRKQLHQFGKIKKLCEPRPGTIAGAFRSKLDGCCGLPKGGSPAIELAESFLLQRSILQIALHGVQFCHRIAHRRTGCKHNSASAGHFIHVPAFQEHIAGFLSFRGREAGYIPHLGEQEQILESVCFIYVQPVNTELFKGDDMIFLFFRFQLFQPDFQLTFGSFQLFDGVALTTVPFHFHDTVRDIVDLLFQQPLLPFLGNRDSFKLAMAKYDGIVITGSDTCAELLAVRFLEVFPGCHEDICTGIEPQEFRSPLFRQVIRHHKHCFLAKAKALGFHDSSYHFEGFARADLVSQQRVPTVENMRNCIPLMLS